MGFAGKVLRSVTGDGHVEAGAEDKQKVAVLQSEVGSARGDIAGAADEGGHVRGNKVGGTPCGDGRDIKQKAKLGELFFRAGEASAVAGEEQRGGRFFQLD